MNHIFDWICYEFNPRSVPAFFEKRRIQASIEMPRKYHHIVPRTNHTVNAKVPGAMRSSRFPCSSVASIHALVIVTLS